MPRDQVISVKITGDARKLGTEFQRASRQLGTFSNVVREASRITDRDLGGGLVRTGRSMSAFGSSLTRNVSIPVGLAMAGVTKSAISFESAFAGVRKTVDATEPQFRALSDGIRRMAREMPVSREEIAGVAEAAGQLGIKTGHLLDFTDTMVKLGVATNMSSQDAATSLARLANITQMPQTEFKNLGAAIVDLGNNFATTESEITEMSLRIAGAGHTIGLSEAQILGFATALSSVGIRADAGGSAISRVFIKIASAVRSGGDDLVAFARVAGMSAEDFRSAYERDAGQAIVGFINGLGRMQKSGQDTFGTLDDLGLSEIRVRDAMLRAAGAGDLLSRAIDTSNQAWEDGTALQTEAQKRFDTTASKLKIMWNRVTDAGMALGGVFADGLSTAMVVLGPVLDTVSELARLFSDLPGPIKGTAVVLAALAVGAGPAITGLGKITTGIGHMIQAGAGLAGLAGRVKTWLMTMAAGPGVLRGAAIQAQFFAAGLSTSTLALGGAGVALAAGTVLLTMWARRKAEARKRVEEFTEALRADSGELGKNTLARLRHTLESRNQTDDLARARVKISEVTDAMRGWGKASAEAHRDVKALGDVGLWAHPERLDVVTDRLRDNSDALSKLLVKLYDAGELNRGLYETLTQSAHGWAAAERTNRYWAAATDATGEAAKGAAGEINKLAAGLDDTGTEADATEDAIKGLKDAVDALFGSTLDSETAHLRWLDSIQRVGQSVKDNGVTLDINTEKGRANRQAIVDSTQAAKDLAQALIDQTGSTDGASLALSGHVTKLAETMRQAGMTNQATIDYIATLFGIPPGKRTDIKNTADLAEVVVDHYLARVNATPAAKNTTFTADTSQALAKLDALVRKYGTVQRALAAGAGSITGRGSFTFGAERIHGGPVPGSKDQAVPILAHGGEYVLSADVVDRIRRGAPSRGAKATTAPLSGRQTIIEFSGDLVAVDPARIADAVALELARRQMVAG